MGVYDVGLGSRGDLGDIENSEGLSEGPSIGGLRKGREGKGR